MTERFPRYDVLAKRGTFSWNEKTRRVIDQRLAVPREPRFLSASECHGPKRCRLRISWPNVERPYGAWRQGG